MACAAHGRAARRQSEDFDGLLTPEGASGATVGSDVADRTLVFGEDGSLGGTL